MPETLEEAVDRLAALAGPDEIEEYLVKGGYVEGAEQMSAFRCPVANYLNDKLGLPKPSSIAFNSCVGVNGFYATYFPAGSVYDDRVVVELPQNVQDFIDRYDTT